MLTPEQIKSLKPGDPIVINTTFISADGDGDLRFKAPAAIIDYHESFILSDYVSLPTEIVNSQSSIGNKHDPTRPFKKGDIVQPRSGKTVLASEYGFVTLHELSGEYEVNDDEARGTVTLIVNGHACFVSAFALELITPVEELGPYTVDECGFAPTLYVRKNGKVYMSIPYTGGSSLYQTREEALAAAEAEAARLNAEYRKEQK